MSLLLSNLGERAVSSVVHDGFTQPFSAWRTILACVADYKLSVLVGNVFINMSQHKFVESRVVVGDAKKRIDMLPMVC